MGCTFARVCRENAAAAGRWVGAVTMAMASGLAYTAPPPGLSGQEWTDIQAQIEASQYALAGEAGVVSGHSAAQALILDFGAGGLRARPADASAGWSLRLRTDSIGRTGLASGLLPVAPEAAGSSVEFRHAGLTEWYRNGRSGVEHGYTLHAAPLGMGQVRIGIGVDGLSANLTPAGDAVLLQGARGATRLRYEKLLVLDATGRVLDSHLEIDGNRIDIAFDDTAAVYPVTVDPLLINEEAKLQPVGDGSFLQSQGLAVAVDGDTALVAELGLVRVFVRSGTTWTEQQRLFGADQAFDDFFGDSVALSGDTALIGAPQDDIGLNQNAGSAHVFVRSGTTWTRQAKLTAPDGSGGDRFGHSVALSGNTALVGANEDQVSFLKQGSAYVFLHSGTDWQLEQKLIASDGAANDLFGSSAALAGDTVVIGARDDDVAFNQQGSAYVFVRSAGVWTEQQKLTASDPALNDNFGNAVAVSGETALIGAFNDDIGANGNQGSAYVFVRSGTVWSEQQKLIAADGTTGASLGFSVSLSGDTALAAAPGADAGVGAAYVFVRSGTVWSAQDKLFATDGAAGDFFGFSAGLSGDTALAGAPMQVIDGQTQRGAAYVFVRTGADWSEQQKLDASNSAQLELFGASVAMSSDTLLVGAPGDDVGADEDRGAAYFFVRSGTSWSLQQKILASGGAVGDLFGVSVAIDGDTALVGAPDDAVATEPGSVYVFVRSGGVWSEQQILAASDGAPTDQFGFRVALSGETALVGAFGDDDGFDQAGSAYVFVRSGTTWSQQQKLTASDPDTNARFGVAVALEGDTALVGANSADVGGLGRGAVYVLVRSGGVWAEQQKLFDPDLPADPPVDDSFGQAVALSGDTALIGAPRNDNDLVVNQGSAHVFVRSGAVWARQQKLIADDGVLQDQFGDMVALQGDIAIVGARLADVTRILVGTNVDEGAAYFFVRSGTTWTQAHKLTAAEPAPGDAYAVGLALVGDTVVVGAPADANDLGIAAGTVYVYRLGLDFGDAPDPTFPSLLASHGARHLIDTAGPRIGTLVDAELDAAPNSGATGDDIAGSDDEDGASFGTLAAGQSGTLSLTLTDPDAALVDGWIDFNQDGDWDDTGEQIFDDVIVINGANNLNLAVPADALLGTAFARLRVSTDGVSGPAGIAPDGEVEDYQVSIVAAGGAAGTIRFSASNYSVGEAGGLLFIEVNRIGGTSGAVSVQVIHTDGSAVVSADFAGGDGLLTWTDGDSATRVVAVSPQEDALVEGNESFTVALANLTGGAALGSPSGATVTIIDNDAPPPPPPPPPPPAPPSLSLSASPTSIVLGASAVLSWDSSNATACLASGAWTGVRPLDGTETITPAQAGTFTHTLTCSKGAQSVTGSVTLNVKAPALVLSLSADAAIVAPGDEVTLSWDSSNVTACTASGEWSGARPVDGSEVVIPTTLGSHSFTLSCTGAGGSVARTAVVRVDAPPPVIDSFAAAPNAILSGQSATLSWDSTDAQICVASGAWDGERPVEGSETVSPVANSGSFAYYLTCSAHGRSVTRNVTVQVSAAPQPPPATLDFFTVSDNTLTLGDNTTLSWASSNATACIASGDWTGDRPLDGSETVTPATAGTRSFTLTCAAGGVSEAQTLLVIVAEAPAAETESGGGAMGLALLVPLGVLALRRRRRRKERTIKRTKLSRPVPAATFL